MIATFMILKRLTLKKKMASLQREVLKIGKTGLYNVQLGSYKFSIPLSKSYRVVTKVWRG